MEVAIPSTIREDRGPKKKLYATVLSVKKYYIYDPLGQFVPSFVGYRLIDGEYQEIDFVNDRLHSNVLGLELGEQNGLLGLYNPITSQWMQTQSERAEHAENRAEQETATRQSADMHAETAEVSLANAIEELEHLKAEKN